MSKKKLIFSLVVASFSAVFCGAIDFANASSVVEVCRLDARIINVTEGYVFVDIMGIRIYNKSSTLCADINKNSDYKITRGNFLKNAYRESIFVGQKVTIDGVSGNAMGPDGPVYWDGWELESAGGKAIKLPITLEKVNINVTVDDTDSLIEGQTYTVAELKANTSITPRKFFTEAYVIGGEFNIQPCPIECPDLPPAYVNLADTLSVMNSVYIDVKSYLNIQVEKGKKYKFEVSVFNTSKTNIQENEFTLVSVNNIDGSVVASETTTPPITDQPTKRSFFGRIWNWFAGLFKR